MIDGEDIIILDRNQQKTITYDHLGNNISTFHLEYYAQAISPIVNNTFFLYNGFEQVTNCIGLEIGKRIPYFWK